MSCLTELSQGYETGDSDLSKELLNEWLDIVETEIFTGTLFEMISMSIESLFDKIEAQVLEEPENL